VLHAHHVELRRRVVELGRQREDLRLAGLGVDLGDGALIHHAEPHIAVLVGLEIEAAHGRALLQLGQRNLLDLAGLGIEPADILLAEIRIPGHAVGADDHVVRLDLGVWQLVFGDDDMGAASLHPRQRL
jgi:hypothetical protein